MIWDETIDTIILVDVELLCTITVAKIPIIKPAKGLVKTTFDLNASEAYLPILIMYCINNKNSLVKVIMKCKIDTSDQRKTIAHQIQWYNKKI